MNLETARILITGGSGLVGSHLREELAARGAKHVHAPRAAEYDLRRPEAAEALFSSYRPEIVFSLAARVGGILDNKTYPADFYFDNIRIGAYTFDAAARFGVAKLVNLGAGCGYPLQAPEPLREESFWDGFPQGESAPYSLAKKMLIVQAMAYRQQYGLKAITLVPSNLYGAHDNFNLFAAHAIPALIRKMLEAVRAGHEPLEVWGDGSAKRDFIHARDLAAAMVEAAIHYDDPMPLNIAWGRQHAVREVVEHLREISGFHGEVVWNTEKPSGQKSREFSLDRLRRSLPSFKPRIGLAEGLRRVYSWLDQNYASARL
jgi:GDP-L-fucose synthase